VEIWFNIISRQAIRRGSFRKVKELIERIERYTEIWNENAHPYSWTATADSILAKVKRLCERISATGHYDRWPRGEGVPTCMCTWILWSE